MRRPRTRRGSGRSGTRCRRSSGRQLEELVARLRDEAATARTESDAAIASAEFERKQRQIAEGRLVESDERAAAIESERQRAVAQLKAAEALADNRLAEQRLLSGRVESLSGRGSQLPTRPVRRSSRRRSTSVRTIPTTARSP